MMSEQEEFYIDSLIAKYIVGEISPSEEKELKEWCALSEENQKVLDDELLIFQKANLGSDQQFDADLAWSKIQPQIHPPKKGKQIFFTPWRIAASFILICAVSFLIYQQLSAPEEFTYLSENQVETRILPDQTQLSLNRDSEVSVEYNERKKTGLIKLSGESLISIPEDKKVKWQVQVNELFIEDIGTVFNVKAYPTSPLVEVSVLEGEVRMYLQSTKGIQLLAGEKGTFNKNTGNFSKEEADANVDSYSTKSFSYLNQELAFVVAQLSQVYQTEIILEGNIGNCRLTVDFEHEDLDTILSIISETLNLDIKRNGSDIVLSGAACN
ncbi:FecR family protein [Algoriphagus lutimaris]|uniref:FecR family protein n=1 Tax=Algoriphagus lutimaris TaxID=613197 RepID=UPI001FAFE8D2|nr:FecR domain-containing protein [Algoriphagus lutimaris]